MNPISILSQVPTSVPYCEDCGHALCMPPAEECMTPDVHTFPQPKKRPETKAEIDQVQQYIRDAIRMANGE